MKYVIFFSLVDNNLKLNKSYLKTLGLSGGEVIHPVSLNTSPTYLNIRLIKVLSSSDGMFTRKVWKIKSSLIGVCFYGLLALVGIEWVNLCMVKLCTVVLMNLSWVYSINYKLTGK